MRIVDVRTEIDAVLMNDVTDRECICCKQFKTKCGALKDSALKQLTRQEWTTDEDHLGLIHQVGMDQSNVIPDIPSWWLGQLSNIVCSTILLQSSKLIQMGSLLLRVRRNINGDGLCRVGFMIG